MNSDNDELKPEPQTALDKELASPMRVRGQHRSHKDVNMLTAAEEKKAIMRAAQGRMVRKKRTSKRYDGRALGSNRPRIDKAMQAFYEEINLPEFKKALEFSNDSKFKMLLHAIANPRLEKCTFAELCRRSALNINDVAGIWRNYQLNRGLIRLMNHMPQVMEDVAIDAKSREVICASCQGTGKLQDRKINKRDNPVCPECHGDGKVRIIGDKDARALAFESAGLHKGGFSTEVNVNIGALPTVEDAIESAERIDIEFQEVANADHPVDEQTQGAGGAGDGAGEEAGAAAPGEGNR